MLALAVAACQREEAPAHRDAPTAAGVAAADAARHAAPLAQSERRTTAGAIAMRNLESEISVLEARFAAGARRVNELTALADLLMTRAVCRGRLADYERIEALGEEAVKIAPDDWAAHLLRARTRAVLHDFDGALAEADEAARRGAPQRSVDALRAEALQERGRSDEGLAIRERLSAGHPDLFALAAQAAIHAERGELDMAEALFTEAQYAYRDVSPFPFAWLYFRQGLAWEKAGDVERARVLYRAALERLTGYVPARARLAELDAATGRTQEAIETLRSLVASTDDPTYAGRLASLLRAAGNDAEAERLHAAAAAAFDALVARHPATFAAKAAEFWLEPGGDAGKALRLAQLNLSARGTPEDRILLVRAQAALEKKQGQVLQ